MIRTIGAIGAAILLATAAPVTAEDTALNDAQIAHIAYTAGQIDADAAKLALERSKNAEVRAFAETMLRDHVAVNEQALALVKKLNVTPQANATSAGLVAKAEAEAKRLSRLEGAAFDRAYAANEAAFHGTVNAALKDALIPGSHNAELKALLETGLALFSEHQAHAEQLARQLR